MKSRNTFLVHVRPNATVKRNSAFKTCGLHQESVIEGRFISILAINKNYTPAQQLINIHFLSANHMGATRAVTERI